MTIEVANDEISDDSRIALWVILAAVSLGGLAIVRLIQRKRNDK